MIFLTVLGFVALSLCALGALADFVKSWYNGGRY